MSAQGRGPDSTLVHMSPREVSGLQSLAMAHGGTLTINPQTGLPEAGFLDSLLPTLLGGAATFFSGGTITPFMAALGVGGLTALTSKDLGKGLMAGLGAYGGSGIVSGLAGLGTGAMSAEAGGAAVQAAGVDPLSFQADQVALNAMAAPKIANASYYDKIAAGASKAMSNPGDALSAFGDGSKLKGAAMFAGPAMAAFSAVDEPKTSMPEKSKTAYIRSYYKDPETGRQMANPAIQAEDWGTRNFGERIYAADGGLMALASGGQTAYDYLDRKRSTSMDSDIVVPGDPVVDDTPPKPSLPPSGSDGKGSYIYNKDSKKWVWTPDAKPVVPVNPGVEVLVGTGGLGGNDGQSSNPGWDDMSDAQKAAFYDAHPNFQAVTQAGQKALGFLGLTNAKQAAIASGTAGLIGSGFSASNEVAKQSDAMPSTTTGLPQGYDTAASRAGNAAATAAAAAAVSDAAQAAKDNADNPTNAAAANATLSAAEAAAADTSGTGGFTSGANADGYGGGDLGGFLAKGGYIGHYAQGGLGSLGGYSDGGRLLRGPGDGVSDSIPATVGGRQPARLADGEFVVPARIVSELGNGSTEAGARALYKMMDRIQANRRKTTGKNSVAVNSKSHKYLPA